MPAHSPDLNIIKTTVGSFEEKSQKSIYSSNISKQLADVLTDDIPLETIHDIYESFLRGLEAVLKANGGETP